MDLEIKETKEIMKDKKTETKKKWLKEFNL